MKSVMSWNMYKKLKLNNLDTTSILHVVGASGESLGARGRTKCQVNINNRIFYQTFIVCEHLKRPMILSRDHRGNQGQGYPRPTLAKCKSQHMHIPHDSRPEGQGTKHSHPICHRKLQPPRTPPPTKGSCIGIRRKRLQ